MTDDIIRQLKELNDLILVANRVVPIARPEDFGDLRTIEERAGRLLCLSQSLRDTEQTVAVVKMACPAHENPARVVGRLGRALREKGVILE